MFYIFVSDFPLTVQAAHSLTYAVDFMI